MSLIGSDFIERRTSMIEHIPEEWLVEGGFNFYQISLKMCQLKQLKYNFRWGTSRVANPKSASIVDMPYRVLGLDISLNDFEALNTESLAQFSQLRTLNASLNRVQSMMGVEPLRNLFHLDLSHNIIKNIHGLQNLRQLTYLYIGMNQIEDMSYMPTLSHLKVLDINNNKLRSLDGIQSLANLQELYCQRNNIAELLPLASSLRLKVLNASENRISSLYTTVEVLRELPKLDILTLNGNPIDKENTYQSKLLQNTSISSLDNVSVRPQMKSGENRVLGANGNMMSIKEAARQAYHDHMREKKMEMDENVRFLQERISNVKREYQEFEYRMERDMDSCMRYLDTLSVSEAERYSIHYLRESLHSPGLKPWSHPSQWKHDPIELPLADPGNDLKQVRRDRQGRVDYSGVKGTDEVLRHAYNELAKEKHRHREDQLLP